MEKLVQKNSGTLGYYEKTISKTNRNIGSRRNKNQRHGKYF